MNLQVKQEDSNPTPRIDSADYSRIEGVNEIRLTDLAWSLIIKPQIQVSDY